MSRHDTPPENETVWFWIDDPQHPGITCMSHNRRGWHLGWWSGTRWHSYIDSAVANDVIAPKLWMSLGLPEVLGSE